MLRALSILAVLGFASTALADERLVHAVAAGEYLGLIAERYGVTVADLSRWNELATDRIRIGQSLIVSPETPSENAREAWTTTYTVVRGDHLARIAERVGSTREALERANPGLRNQRLRPGMSLAIVGGTRIVDHQARRGETLARLADRYEVRHRDLLEWNPVLRRRGLEAGMTLRIYSDVRMSRSESVGAPNLGTLSEAEPLPAHRAYVIRNPTHSYGTSETVQWIVEAFDAALDADPDMPRVRIHDLSSAEGGRLSGHRSHQSGRDADIAYYRRQCRSNEPCFWSRTGPEDFDAAHTWRVMRYWLERELVTAIFVDYALQQPLYDYARSHGATREQLGAWFQYPRGVDVPTGIIRHFPAHADHFHVRFTCPRGDETCIEAVRRPAPARPREAPTNATAEARPEARATERSAEARANTPETSRPVPATSESTPRESPSSAAPEPDALEDEDEPLSDAPGESG